jgi:soluble lytic murein transglycosylase-like protein
MKLRGYFALAILATALPASAGTLYRCVGADGISNYSSKRMSNAVCKVLAVTPTRVSVASRSSGKPEYSASARTGMGLTPGLSIVSHSPAPTMTPAVATQPAASPAVAQAPTTGAAAVPAASNRNVVFRTAAQGSMLTPSAVGAGTRVTRGAVYKFQKDGITHYTNIKPAGVSSAKMLFSYMETCYACGAMPGVNFRAVSLNTVAYQAEISSAARQYGVEEAVVRAIIHAESAFRPNAMSHAGAQGLMQLIPGTAARFGVSDAFNPAQNIRGGVAYLAWLMQRYSSNLTLVAAAYNAGEGAVDRNGGVPPYSETQRYVERVGQLADRYRTALAGTGTAVASANTAVAAH